MGRGNRRSTSRKGQAQPPGKGPQQPPLLSRGQNQAAIIGGVFLLLGAVVAGVFQVRAARIQNPVVVSPTVVAALSTATATMTAIPATATVTATDVPLTMTVALTATETPPSPTAVTTMVAVLPAETAGLESISRPECGDGFVDFGDPASEPLAFVGWKEEPQNNQPPSDSGDMTMRAPDGEWANTNICLPHPEQQHLLTIEAQNSGCSVKVFADRDYLITLGPDSSRGETKLYQKSFFARTGEVTLIFQTLAADGCAAPGIYNARIELQP